MTAISLLHVFSRTHERQHRRKHSDPLTEARARLRAYTSPLAALSEEQKAARFAYDGEEVAGNLPYRRRTR